MTRIDENKLAQLGEMDTAPGDPSATCRDGSSGMHPTPGAVPSQEMIEALSPERLSTQGWPEAMDTLGLHGLAEEGAPQIVGMLLLLEPNARERLVRMFTSQTFYLVSAAVQHSPHYDFQTAYAFPGLVEAFFASHDRAKHDLLPALGQSIH